MGFPDGGGPPPVVIYNGPNVIAVGVAMGAFHAAAITAGTSYQTFTNSYNTYLATQSAADQAVATANIHTAIADLNAADNAANNAMGVVNANAPLPGNIGPTALNALQATLVDIQNALAQLQGLLAAGL